MIGARRGGRAAAARRRSTAVRRLVEAGAKPRAAASVVAELTGARANALYARRSTEPERATH